MFKSLLKNIGIYHPLQRIYRQSRFGLQHRKIKRQFRHQLGQGFTCNICSASYKSFAPRNPSKEDRGAIEKNKVIAGYGENIYCPNCMSTARERLVIAMLHTMKPEGKKILHLSPEEKIFQYLKGKANVVTADLFPGFYKNIDPGIIKADVTRLPFAPASFDIVIGNHMLEHIPDDRQAMSEIYRVLENGGIAILQVPFSAINSTTTEEPLINDPAKQSELFGQKDHIRIYNLQDYINRLRSVGFRVAYSSYEALDDLHKFAIQPQEGFLHITK